MRSTLLVFLWVVALSFCSGQTRTSKGTQDKQTILHLDREFTEASISGKCDVVERILANNYAGTGSDGTALNKTQVVESCKSLAAYPESIRPKPEISVSDSEVRFYENVAIVIGKRRAQQELATYSDWVNKRPPFTVVEEVRYTMVWVMTNDRWQLVSSQATKIAQPDRR
jgi:hypothetical protein